MAHFCHLLFPDYAQALPIVQPTESIAAFSGFPNSPENLLQPDEGTAFSLGSDRVRFKVNIFLLFQKSHNKENNCG